MPPACNRKTRLDRCVLAIAVVMTASACASSEKPEARTAPPDGCPPGTTPSAGGCVSPPPVQPPPPGPEPAAPGASGGAAAPVDASLVAPLLDPLARQYLPPGAKPVGPALAGQFDAGESLEQPIQLQPGKCYTVVGAAAPTMQDLDIRLLPPALPGVPSAVVAQDQTVGPSAVLGPAPNCFHWAAPFSAPMRVVLIATAGSGLAGARVYEQ